MEGPQWPVFLGREAGDYKTGKTCSGYRQEIQTEFLQGKVVASYHFEDRYKLKLCEVTNTEI